MHRWPHWRFVLLCLAATAPAIAAPPPRPVRMDASFVCGDGTPLRLVMLGTQAFARSGEVGPARLLIRLAGDQPRYQSASEVVTITGNEARWQQNDMVRTCTRAPVSAPPDGFAREGDTLVHGQSGMRFPPLVAGFVRDFGSTFDFDGNYVVVRYLKRVDNDVIEARAGVLHLEGMRANEHFAGFRSRVLADLGGGTGFDEGPVPVAGQRSAALGYGGRFQSADGTRGAMLITLALGYWSARLRSDWPAHQAGKGRRELLRLARALDWAPVLHAPPRRSD